MTQSPGAALEAQLPDEELRRPLMLLAQHIASLRECGASGSGGLVVEVKDGNVVEAKLKGVERTFRKRRR